MEPVSQDEYSLKYRLQRRRVQHLLPPRFQLPWLRSRQLRFRPRRQWPKAVDELFPQQLGFALSRPEDHAETVFFC